MTKHQKKYCEYIQTNDSEKVTGIISVLQNEVSVLQILVCIGNEIHHEASAKQ